MVSECRGGINNAGCLSLRCNTSEPRVGEPRAVFAHGDDRFSRIIRRPARPFDHVECLPFNHFARFSSCGRLQNCRRQSAGEQ